MNYLTLTQTEDVVIFVCRLSLVIFTIVLCTHRFPGAFPWLTWEEVLYIHTPDVCMHLHNVTM